MKLTLALLLIGTTLGTGSAALAAGQGGVLMPRPALVGLHPVAIPGAAVTLIDNDDDDDDNEGGRFRWLSGNDDDDDECAGEDDDDDDCAAGNTGNAAKAGTVAPPQNGLFTDGTAPVVKSN